MLLNGTCFLVLESIFQSSSVKDVSVSLTQKSEISMLLTAGMKNEGNDLIPRSWELIQVLARQ